MFNNKERKIINVLYQYQSPLTMGKVTKYSGYSYNTVRKYLKSLSDNGYVECMHYRNAICWWLREEKER